MVSRTCSNMAYHLRRCSDPSRGTRCGPPGGWAACRCKVIHRRTTSRRSLTRRACPRLSRVLCAVRLGQGLRVARRSGFRGSKRVEGLSTVTSPPVCDNLRTSLSTSSRTFRARLQTTTYVADVPSGQADVKIAKFNDTKGTGGALVVWTPTSSATVHNGYALALPTGSTSARAVALVDKQADGVETALMPTGGRVTLDVTETPTVVLYGP